MRADGQMLLGTSAFPVRKCIIRHFPPLAIGYLAPMPDFRYGHLPQRAYPEGVHLIPVFYSKKGYLHPHPPISILAFSILEWNEKESNPISQFICFSEKANVQLENGVSETQCPNHMLACLFFYVMEHSI